MLTATNDLIVAALRRDRVAHGRRRCSRASATGRSASSSACCWWSRCRGCCGCASRRWASTPSRPRGAGGHPRLDARRLGRRRPTSRATSAQLARERDHAARRSTSRCTASALAATRSLRSGRSSRSASAGGSAGETPGGALDGVRELGGMRGRERDERRCRAPPLRARPAARPTARVRIEQRAAAARTRRASPRASRRRRARSPRRARAGPSCARRLERRASPSARSPRARSSVRSGSRP